MRNILSIIVLLFLYLSIIAAKNPIQNPNLKNDDSTHLNEIEAFNFIFSQKHWKYSTFDSLYVDYTRLKKDTVSIEGEQFIQTTPLKTKLVFTKEEKLNIYLVAKKVKFDLLSEHLELKNIFYFNEEFEQKISIYLGKENHSVDWDGLYPDLGNNKYVLKHRKLVNRYKEVSDTIYSILIKKIELQKLYTKDGELKNLITVRGVRLSKIGFPKKYIPKIGRYRWGITAS